MEPYARAYLQFLTCAAQGGDRHTRSEAFVFATRLTRLTRALHSRNPERAIQRAAATAPDWSSGTRIGDALKTFNDRHGRRGMARGAVVVILSDGWERGDPALVGREMERLSRLAYRIVWVNPRVRRGRLRAPRGRDGGGAALLRRAGQRPQPGGTARRWSMPSAPGARDGGRAAGGARATAEPEEESWPSATPVPGSSVAMPSGYGPERVDHTGLEPRAMEPLGRCGRLHATGHCPAQRRAPAEDLHLPGVRAPGGAAPRLLGGPQPSFCDLEEHNALTAHQERQRLAAQQRSKEGVGDGE